MHRIDSAGATVGGMWTEGDPSTGAPATEFTSDFMNAVQEELIAVITAAGISLNKASNAQLLAAMLVVISNNMKPQSYTVGALPTASSNTGRIVYVSNETGGATLAFSDGTNWRRVQDRNVVS
jgi:hypothetical protein